MSKTNNKSTNTATAVSDAITKARDALAACDSEIDRLLDERVRVASAPPTREEAVAALQARIEAAAANGRRRLDQLEDQLTHPGGADAWEPTDELVKWAAGTGTWVPNRSFLLAVLSDTLKGQLEQRMAADERFDRDGISGAQREKRLAELDTKIEEARVRRDRLEAELAAAGFFPEAELTAPEGGDQGMAAFAAEHERRRQGKNAELQRAGVTQRAQPRVIEAFAHDKTIRVGEK